MSRVMDVHFEFNEFYRDVLDILNNIIISLYSIFILFHKVVCFKWQKKTLFLLKRIVHNRVHV